MTLEQSVVFGVLGAALVLFILGRWRYDLVALMALMVVTIAGIISFEDVFRGFSHPAVVTVAAVLVLSKALQNSGVVDLAARLMSRVGGGLTVQLLSLTGLVAVCSAFMNNVGALALMLPLVVRMARKSETPPSFLLMPLAFGSLLGGMTTLIGTPPNIIVASFRGQDGAAPFRMFDFAPVGLGIALAGVLFISLVGWRLLPTRKGQASAEELFKIEDYITEVRVPEDSSAVGKSLSALESEVDAEFTVVGIVRGEQRLLAPYPYEAIRPDDILIVECTSEDLEALLDSTGFELAGDEDSDSREALGSDDVSIIEAVVMPDSPILGRSAQGLNLRWRYGVNLLAVARQGARIEGRLANIRFRPSDVLLLQGRADSIHETQAAHH